MIPLPAAVCPQLMEALISLGGKPHSIHAGWFLISVANLIVIVLMIAAFLLALFLPFPDDRDEE